MFKTFSRLGYRPTQTTEDRITLNKGKDYMRRFVKKIDKKQSEDNEDLRAVIIYIKTHGSQGSGKLLQSYRPVLNLMDQQIEAKAVLSI